MGCWNRTSLRGVRICYHKKVEIEMEGEEKKINGGSNLHLCSALCFIKDWCIFMCNFHNTLWVDWVHSILILRFRELKLWGSKMTFPLVIQLISVSFRNSVLSFFFFNFVSSFLKWTGYRGRKIRGPNSGYILESPVKLYKERKMKQNKLLDFPGYT